MFESEFERKSKTGCQIASDCKGWCETEEDVQACDCAKGRWLSLEDANIILRAQKSAWIMHNKYHTFMLGDLLDKFPPYHGPGYNYTKAEVDAWLEKACSLLGEIPPDKHPLIDLANRALALYDEIALAGPSDSYLLIMAGTLANDLKQLVSQKKGDT